MSPRSEEFMGEARRALSAAHALVGGAHFARSVSDSYYAMLYAARAALSEVDTYAKTHSGTWDRFHVEFVATGRFDGDLAGRARRSQEQREGVDYDALGIDEPEARDLAELAERFVVAVEEMLSEPR